MEGNSLYKLFVYGSLRSGFNSPEYAYISRYFNCVGTAKVKGVLYDLGDYPAALPAEDENYLVGEVYQIKNEQEFNWAIEQVDDYEGVNAMPGEQPLYRRDACIAQLLNNEQVTCWIYWYNRDVTGKPMIGSGDVLEYFRQKNK